MRFFAAVLIAVLLLAIAALIVIREEGRGLTTQPEHVQIDSNAVFVYPAGDVFLLATTQGPYQVGADVKPGCYRLDPPAFGQAYGQAVWVWPECRK